MYEDSTPAPPWRRKNRLLKQRPVWTALTEADRHLRLTDTPVGGWLTERYAVRADLDRLRAYDLTTGIVRWTRPLPAPHTLDTVSPDVDNDTVLLLHFDDSSWHTDGRITAVDLTNGRQQWSRPLDPDVTVHRSYGRPNTALSARTGGAHADDRHLIRFAPDTGTMQWRRPAPSKALLLSTWVVSLEPLVVIVESPGPRVHQEIRVHDGAGELTFRFRLPAPYTELNPPALVLNGLLIAAMRRPERSGHTKRLAAVDLSTGKLRWEWRAGYDVVRDLTAHRGRLLVLHAAGHRVAALDPATGNTVMRRFLWGDGGQLLRAADTHFAVFNNADARRPLRLFRWR